MEVRAPGPFRIVAFSGNTHRPSKSRGLAGAIASALANRLSLSVENYDVLDFGSGLGAVLTREHAPSEIEGILSAIETADALIIATPVYKGSYPGLFKHVIDLLHPTALANKPVLLSATGGGQRHALVIEHQLRPLFGFFSAQIAATGIYACDAEFMDGRPSDSSLLARIDKGAGNLAHCLVGQQRLDEQFAIARVS